MFSNEDTLQSTIHERPDLVLSGIPEINPQFCPDAPCLLSLGREISLTSGPIDNLFIDVNAVLTFVECKRYSDSRIRREVYPQALNYASDLQNTLSNYNGEDFYNVFGNLISSAQGGGYSNIEDVLVDLEKDPILEGKNINEWRRQFVERFEYNVKSGICRVVILCAPAPNNVFNARAIRNLMQLMSFSEHSSSRYDLLLMDLREERDALVSRIVWRRYSALPQIPLVVDIVRDTAAAIDRMMERESNLPEEHGQRLGELLRLLSDKNLIAVANAGGYAVKSEDTKKSVYVKIMVQDQGLSVIRHQIGPSERFYAQLESQEKLEFLNDLNAEVRKSSSTSLFEIEFSIDPQTNIHRAVDAIVKLARFDGGSV